MSWWNQYFELTTRSNCTAWKKWITHWGGFLTHCTWWISEENWIPRYEVYSSRIYEYRWKYYEPRLRNHISTVIHGRVITNRIRDVIWKTECHSGSRYVVSVSSQYHSPFLTFSSSYLRLRIQKLPKNPINDVTIINETELWNTYFDSLLPCVVADSERSVLLRWVDKVISPTLPLRPDAVVSIVDQLKLG